jgi:hypothetical protein
MQFIHLVDGACSKEFCNHLINFFETNINLAKPGKAGVEKLNNLEIELDLTLYSKNPDICGLIENMLFQYKQKFPLIDSSIGKWNVSPTCLLAKYEPNNYYNHIHCECDGEYIHRIFGWMMYLNDIEDGGGTYFPHQNFTTKPDAGNLYIWPAGWTHMHQGVNAPKEIKYTLTGWVEYNYKY